MDSFKALVVEREGDKTRVGIEDLLPSQLHDGEVTIKVEYSSVNYKDGLATLPNGGVARVYPLIPGVDLAGEVISSDSVEFSPGEKVIAHGYEIGVSHHGGFAEMARIPANWVLPLPSTLSTREAMTFGTAGFTAAEAVIALEDYGISPGTGPVLVTGATGGVGSHAVAMLAKRGYEVVASTGKLAEEDFLKRLGASSVIDRQEVSKESPKPLESARWAAAVDCVGSTTLSYILSTLRYGAAIAATGLVGGAAFTTTVMPFILRGVSLLGIDSAHLEMEKRRQIWERLGSDLRPDSLEVLGEREVTLDELPSVLEEILRGGIKGRTLVRLVQTGTL